MENNFQNDLFDLTWDSAGGNQLIPQDYFGHVEQAESGGRADASNPRSSALGPYQFTTKTWESLMAQHPDLDLTAEGRTDPAQAQRAVQQLTADNAKYLAGIGVPTNDANLYAAHFLGASRAGEVLSSPDDEKIANIVPHAVVAANPFLADMSVGDFKNWAGKKMTGQAARETVQSTGQKFQATSQASPAPVAGNNRDLLKLMLLASMGNVRLQPVDYDPFKLMPHFEGAG